MRKFYFPGKGPMPRGKHYPTLCSVKPHYKLWMFTFILFRLLLNPSSGSDGNVEVMCSGSVLQCILTPPRLRSIHGALPRFASLTSKLAPTSQKGTLWNALGCAFSWPPSLSIFSRNYLQFLSKDLFSSKFLVITTLSLLAFYHFLFLRIPGRMTFLDLIKSHLTKMPFIEFSSLQGPQVSRGIYTLTWPQILSAGTHFSLLTIGSALFYFSPFIVVTLSNKTVSSLRKNSNQYLVCLGPLLI